MCIQGAKAETLTNELQQPKYQDRIVLVVGTNDIGILKDDEGSTSIIPKFENLIKKAKTNSQKASAVCISSVCPHLDQLNMNEKIDGLNANLQSFTLGDGTIKNGYMARGKDPHLSKAGVNKLVSNLKIRTKQGVSDVT